MQADSAWTCSSHLSWWSEWGHGFCCPQIVWLLPGLLCWGTSTEATRILWPESIPGPNSERLQKHQRKPVYWHLFTKLSFPHPMWCCLCHIATLARQKSSIAGQDPPSPPRQQAKTTQKSCGYTALCPALQSVLLETSWLQTKINAHTIFPTGSPQLLEAQQMCLGCFTSQNYHMHWAYFF